MVHRSGLLALSTLVLWLAGGAHAAMLTSATWFQVSEGIPMTRTIAQLGAAGTASFDSISVSLSYPAFATTFFVPKGPYALLDLGYRIHQGGPQQITATPGMAAGSPAVPGTILVKTAVHGAMGLDQSMFMLGDITLLRVPLRHGEAAQFTETQTIVDGLTIHVTVDFYAWTPGTVVLTGLTSSGVPLPDVSAMGLWHVDGTPNEVSQGEVLLVAPSKISIDGALQRRTASFTTLRVALPEPHRWLLLAAGGLALAGARRRRPARGARGRGR